MNIQAKLLIGGGIVVAALAVSAYTFSRPSNSDQVVGTVVPVERYRAPQSGPEALKTGEPLPSTAHDRADQGSPRAATAENTPVASTGKQSDAAMDAKKK